MIIRRGSGILLHITSLPAPFGIGDLGDSSYRFADFLAETKQSYWQILPLSPTDPVGGANSPYSSTSAFAGSTLMISPQLLQQDGYLTAAHLEKIPPLPDRYVDYVRVTECRRELYDLAYANFKQKKAKHDYERFCADNAHWLDDFAQFVALKAHFHGAVWSDWPVELRDRHAESLKYMQGQLQERIEREKFLQFVFFEQWQALKTYCNERGIQFIGDIPIYVSYDSADVWTHPELFKLNWEKKPYVVAGVPPDYFSRTGQLWGNPIYNWDAAKAGGYSWWIQRIGHNLRLFDMVRIDHFRGFVGFWEVPAGEPTAINGRWVDAPVMDFFTALYKRFPNLPIIAEDLGVITPDVREVMHKFEFPGMRVLLFAFDDSLPRNPYAPHNHVKNCLVYTGTHDNNTARGWFENEADQSSRERFFSYIGKQVPAEQVGWEFSRLAMASVAGIAILPMQDILGLDASSRMNLPSTVQGNWQWRLLPNELTPELKRRLREMTEIYGRA